MNPVGIAVITKLPYELIEIQALFNVVENVCIGYFAVNVQHQDPRRGPEHAEKYCCR